VDTETVDASPTPAAPVEKHRTRRIIAATLAVLAALTTTFAVTGAWVRRTTIDTNHWVDTVGPLASDPKVQAALAQWSTDQLSQLIDVQGYVADALPRRGQILAGPIASAVNGFIETEATKFFASDAFAKLWVAANREVHARVVKVLKGDSQVVTTQSGKVVIDFMPLLLRILQNVDQRANGLLSSHVPAISQDLTGDEIRTKLSDALKRPIPNDFGTIAVFDDSQLSAIQQAVQWFQAGVYAFIVLALLFIGAAIWVAPDRRRIAIWLGLGTAVALVTFRTIARAAIKEIVGGITIPRNRDVAVDVLHKVFSSYRTLTLALMFLGLVVALTAFLAGPGRVAVWLRRGVREQAWLSEYRAAIGVAVLIAALAAVLLWSFSLAGLIVLGVVVAILELVLWRLPSGPAPVPTAT
jgi:hypothetical protein